jgi:hypothetical protein
MVATQQVRENMIYMLEQGWLLGFDSQKAVVVNLSKQNSDTAKVGIDHTIKSTVEDRPNQEERLELTQANQTQPRFPLIM